MPQRALLLSSLLLLLSACDGPEPAPTDAGVDAGGEADAGAPMDWPAEFPEARTEPEPGITREISPVLGVAPPANPSTGASTHGALNGIRLVRYRPTTEAGVEPEARAIVLAMPGFLGGAGSFEMLARHLVRRGIEAGQPVEVWAIDRRANFLEDTRGMDAAEQAGDPAIARGYYFEGHTIGTEPFAGLLDPEEVSFMSEWGLATHVGDVRALIELIPEASRRGHLFLLGHSMGASFTEIFAAWDFDGDRGDEMLAGLILVDGAAGSEPLGEEEYFGGVSGGPIPTPGVDEIRASAPYVALPLLGVEVHLITELVALDATLDPAGFTEDSRRDQMLATLMGLSRRDIPRMTNAAAFGFGFDDSTNGLSFAAVSLGQPSGGPMERYESPLFGATLERPSDPEATYGWVDALEADPAEHTPQENLAHAYIDGRTNFAEWYFPARLSLDIAAVGGLEGAGRPGSEWMEAEGLLASRGAEVEAPILAIAAALARPERYEAARARVAPVVGEGRPNAGAGRGSAGADEAGFTVVDVAGQTHIDPLTAADVPSNPVPQAIFDFLLANSEAGTVSVPAIE